MCGFSHIRGISLMWVGVIPLRGGMNRHFPMTSMKSKGVELGIKRYQALWNLNPFTVIPTFTKILAKSSWSSSINIPMFSIYLALISVLFNGILFMIFSIGKIRELIINSVPESIKFGIAIGIGLFISTISLSNIGLIAPGNGLVTINWN